MYSISQNFVPAAASSASSLIATACNPNVDAACKRYIRLATVFDNHGNQDRQAISDLTTANHKRYADKWNLGHDVVTDSLVADQCTNPLTQTAANCSAYWNKIKYFMNWCNEPGKPGTEEWVIYADDDAAYTNLEIDPDLAIDELRGEKDTSFIVATEGPVTRYSEDEEGARGGSIKGAANTGVMIVRKDPRGCGIIERIWNKRDKETSKDLFDPSCPTRGICKDQRHGDEQGALDEVLWGDIPSSVGRDVTRITPRDVYSPTRSHLAFNTIYRNGCVQAFKEGNIGGAYDSMLSDLKINREGIWHPNDWIGQTAGYPMYGRDLSHQPLGDCKEDAGKPIEPIRIKKVKNLITAADLSLTNNPPRVKIKKQIKQEPSALVASFPSSLACTLPTVPRASRRLTLGTAYDNKGEPKRDAISALVNANHEEYSRAWGMRHIVSSESLLQNACTDLYTNTAADCAPYWNKIQLLRNWLQEPKEAGVEEEWFLFVDDDMVVTNLEIDPTLAIDQLRKGDESVVILRDVVDWLPWRFPKDENDPRAAVNTGLMLIRKDDAARDFVEKIWSHRQDTVNNLDEPVCPTLGMCKNQNSLHEQEAAAKVLKEDPSLLDRVVAVPFPRDTSAPCRVAANTFKREGCFVRKQHNWDANAFSYYESDRWSPWGAFRPGDWMAQTAGVPIWGKLIPVKADESCHDDPNIPETEIRKQYIEDLLAESSKTRQPDISLGNSST